MTRKKLISMVAALCLIFLIGGCKPVVTITSPQDGDQFAVGEEITFSGNATVFPAGAIPGDSLIWVSDKDGEIGRGETFTKSDLSEGVHKILLTAIYKVRIGVATIQITVGNPE
jgi:hypothetical protein